MLALNLSTATLKDLPATERRPIEIVLSLNIDRGIVASRVGKKRYIMKKSIKQRIFYKNYVSMCFLTVCSVLTFCPHTDYLKDMRQEKYE